MLISAVKLDFRSGYDRGHMVPAADASMSPPFLFKFPSFLLSLIFLPAETETSQRAMDETFLLTNIAPQVGEGFNRHYWAYVEDFCRRLTGNFDDVYVFTSVISLGKWERGADFDLGCRYTCLLRVQMGNGEW